VKTAELQALFLRQTLYLMLKNIPGFKL